MHILSTLGAQGEIRMFRVDAIPADVTPLTKDDPAGWVIGHSETGHHHVLVAEAEVYEAKDAPEGMRVLYALLRSPGHLEHRREFDTHEPHRFEAGDKIMFRTDREYDPYAEMARRVAD